MYMLANPLELPDEVNPRIGGKGFTRNGRRLAAFHSVPNIPFSATVEITFRTEDPATIAKSLIHIEFERLWTIGLIDHEIGVVSEPCQVCATAEKPGPQLVGISGRSAHREFRRSATQRRR